MKPPKDSKTLISYVKFVSCIFVFYLWALTGRFIIFFCQRSSIHFTGGRSYQIHWFTAGDTAVNFHSMGTKELHIFCAAFNKYITYRSPSKPPLTPLGFISCRSLCFVVKTLGKSFKCWKYSHSSLQTPHEVSTTGKSFPGLWEDLGRASFRGWTVEPNGPSDPSVNGDTKAYQKSILKRPKCHSQYYPFHTCNTLLKGKYSSLLLLLSFHPSLFRPFSLSWLFSSCSRGFIPGWHPFGISHKYTVARGCYLAVPK